MVSTIYRTLTPFWPDKKQHRKGTQSFGVVRVQPHITVGASNHLVPSVSASETV